MTGVVSNFEKLVAVCEYIYKCTFEASLLIENDQFELLDNVIADRGKLIAAAEELKKDLVFSEEQKIQLDGMVQEIKTLDDKNLSKLEIIHAETKRELSNITKGNKLLAAYKINKEAESTFFDVKE